MSDSWAGAVCPGLLHLHMAGERLNAKESGSQTIGSFLRQCDEVAVVPEDQLKFREGENESLFLNINHSRMEGAASRERLAFMSIRPKGSYS